MIATASVTALFSAFTQVRSQGTASIPDLSGIWGNPYLYGIEPPKPRIEAVRIVDMSASNSWAEFAALFRNTRQAFLDHERSKAELKALMPQDAKEAIGHGVRAKRSKSGAVSFDLLELERGHAAVQ